MKEQPKTIQEQIQVSNVLKISKVVVWSFYIFIVIGIISLLLRVLLLLFSADQTAGFSELVATISNDFMQPFRGIFPPRQVGETGYLDVSALFAIIVYLFVLWGSKSLVEYVEGKIEISKAEQKERLLELQARERTRKIEEMRRIELEAKKAKTTSKKSL
jgi:uncharacterized protein YggT (Ycf19 family)